MSKITITGFALLSVLFFGNSSENYAAQPRQNTSDGSTGTLQKMIVENGSVTLNVDLNGLNGSKALITRPAALQFAAATNSFFPFSSSTTSCAVPSPARSRWSRRAGRFPCCPHCWRPLSSSSSSKNSLPIGVRHGCARRENRLHVFQHRRTSIRLRCQGAVTRYPRWTASDVKRVCHGARPSRGC